MSRGRKLPSQARRGLVTERAQWPWWRRRKADHIREISEAGDTGVSAWLAPGNKGRGRGSPGWRPARGEMGRWLPSLRWSMLKEDQACLYGQGHHGSHCQALLRHSVKTFIHKETLGYHSAKTKLRMVKCRLPACCGHGMNGDDLGREEGPVLMA